VQQAALLHTPNTATVLQTEATATPANAPTATPPTPAAVTTATPTVTATTSAKPSTAPTASYTPARFDAAYLDNPAPRYPALSRKTGESGKVVLKVHVSAAGLPERIEMHSSSGFERLDNAATTAVQRWKFVPAQQNGEAVAAWVLVPLAFNLKE
jgi:protein TonB